MSASLLPTRTPYLLINEDEDEDEACSSSGSGSSSKKQDLIFNIFISIINVVLISVFVIALVFV